MGRKSEIEYLEEERQKLWAAMVSQSEQIKKSNQKIEDLVETCEAFKVELEKRTPEHEKDAKASSGLLTRYKNKATEAVRTIEESAAKVNELLEKATLIEDQFSSITASYEVTLAKQTSFDSLYVELNSKQATLGEKLVSTEELLDEAEVTLDNAAAIKTKIEELKVSSDGAVAKISALHLQVAARNNEITTLHNEIFGYSAEDNETGEIVEVSGLKTKLDSAYRSLTKNLQEYSSDLSSFREAKIGEFNEFSIAKTEEFELIKNKIRSLLPDAMTAGLSHAYELKRITEEKNGRRASITFGWAIFALSMISILPVAVSLYSFLKDGKTLDQVVQHLPQVVSAILPLYIPTFWFAISANKRIKLSKRLTEEYAHKEALSKTFEGLSTQINSLEDNEVSRDLRLRLLYNIINTSSENPGRLISDYNTSDNPVMDVLDKSLALSKSLEKVSAIPGVEKVLTKLRRKREERSAAIETSLAQNISVEDDEKQKSE